MQKVENAMRKLLRVPLKIRTKIILIFIVTFSIPIAVSLILIHSISTQYSEESMKTLNVNNIKYVQASANRFLGTAYDFSMYLNQDKNILAYFSAADPEAASLQYAVQDTLATLPLSNTFIKSVEILGIAGQYVGSGTERLSFSDEDILRAEQHQGAYFWSTPSGRYHPYELQFCRMLRQPSNLSNAYGYLKIGLNLEELDKILYSSTDDGYSYCIIDEDNRIIYSGGETGAAEMVGEMTPDFLREYDGQTRYVESLGRYLTPASLDYSGWYICSISSDRITPYLTQSLRGTLAMAAVLCFVFCFVLAFFLTGIVVSPLAKLGKLMENVREEDYSVRFHPRGNDEIAALAGQFNHMTERLGTLYREVYLSNLKLKDSQLAALQAQINPHFLYNTLDTIYWMSQSHHTDDVSQMVSSLSKLFRLSLSGDENDMVPLSQELAHVECYMHIQQIRFQDQLAYNIRSTANAGDLLVLKLVLQPIIENAVQHGIESRGRVGIQIHIDCLADRLVYTVADDAGAADVRAIRQLLQEPVKDGQHLGLKNIQDRIRLRFGEEYGICCAIEQGRTVFRIELPIVKQEGQGDDQAADSGR